MQIQLTITESFGDVVSFAEFAQALQGFLAGRTHSLQVSSKAVAAAVSPRTRDAIANISPQVLAPHVDRVTAPPEPAEPELPMGQPEPTEAASEPAKPRRGRPPRAKADEPAAEPVAAPAPTAADPFGMDVATAEAKIDAAPKPVTYDAVRAKVLRFVELRPDRAKAATEWAAAMKAEGYAGVTDITNDRASETALEKAARVDRIVGTLERMIADAEEAAKAAKAK